MQESLWDQGTKAILTIAELFSFGFQTSLVDCLREKQRRKGRLDKHVVLLF